MSGKSDSKRIKDTLDMIGRTPDVPPAVSGAIVTMIKAQFPRMTDADLVAYKAMSTEMSVKAGVAVKADRGTSAEREMRRAIMLMWTAAGKRCGQDVFVRPLAQAAMTMPAGALAAEFDSAMLKVATVSSAVGAQWAFQEWTAHPVRFIARHKVFIVGVPDGQERFSTQPNGNHRNVLGFHFQYDLTKDRFVLRTVPAVDWGTSHAFNAVSVPAVHWTAVPGVGAAPPHGFGGLLGCEMAGANVMLTTQFTGCAFNWTNQGGLIRASHISPSGGGVGSYPGGGIALAQRMIANGAMSNAANMPVTVFGAGAGNAPLAEGNPFYPNAQVVVVRWGTIFGVNKTGSWRFYLQVVNGDEQIIESRRIM